MGGGVGGCGRDVSSTLNLPRVRIETNGDRPDHAGRLTGSKTARSCDQSLQLREYVFVIVRVATGLHLCVYSSQPARSILRNEFEV